MPNNTTIERARELALEAGEELLDRSRPLWLIYVMENVEGKTVVVQITHHAFVDGATAVALTIALSTMEPDMPDPDPEDPPWQPDAEPAPFALWQEAVTENAQRAISDTQQAMSNIQLGATVAQKAGSLMQRLARPVMQAPWNASLVGPKRSYTSLRYPLDQVKAVSRAMGGTLNDLVVAVVMEGAARYLAANGESLDGQFLRLMCPVNVREPGEDPLSAAGNRVSAMFPVLAAEPQPMAERFAAVQQELADIKQKEEPWVLDQLQQLQPNVPPVAMAQTLTVGTQWDPTTIAARAPLPVMPHGGGQRPQQLGFNFTCTNVPGPAWTQYVANKRVETIFGTLMLSGNLGMGSTAASFAGQMYFGFTADPRLVPNLKQLADYVAQAFNELETYATNNSEANEHSS